MKNMKVSMKLIVSFVIVIVLAVIVGTVGIIGMFELNKAESELYEYNLLAVSAMGEIRENMQRVRVGLRNFVLYAEDSESLKTQKATMDTVVTQMGDLFIKYEATITDESLEQSYYDAKKQFQDWFVPLIDQVYNASLHSYDEARSLIFSDSVAKNTTTMVDDFTLSMRNNEQWAKEADDAGTSLFNLLTIVLVAVMIVAIAVSMFLAFYISNLISKPLVTLTSFMQKAGSTGDIALRSEDLENINRFAQNKDETGVCIASTASFIKHITTISEELETIASGDLTTKVEVLSEKDVMGVSMKKMVDNLNNMFSEINSSTAQVSTGAKQIADGSQALAQGSTQQAAAVEQLSSSISEIAEKTKINSEMADKAAKLAETIKGNAEKGSRQMDEMMSAVKEINQASQSINKVISVIDNIAFQTNILALNAAVEAARAGQHGKGFAVVAEEVRNLASKSAEAAKETGALIANSMEKAELGARIADETAASLIEIVSGINESTRLVGDIAVSSSEQSEGIAQVNRGIDQVAQVVQQNSATSEQSAAASEEMSGQASMLESLIAQFKLKDSAMGRRSSLPSPAKSAPRKQLNMPEKTSYAPSFDSEDGFGKY